MRYRYAPLSRRDTLVDPEAGLKERSTEDTAVLLSPPFPSPQSIPKRKRDALLVGVTLTLFGIVTYRLALQAVETYFLPYVNSDDSDIWANSYRIGQKLTFIQEDGEHSPLKNGSLPARWPGDYPKASSYLRENSIIRDVADPWPEKPWIASIWLAPERFPPGLHGQPHDPEPLPAIGRENGRKPSPGLHDPPLPHFPERQMENNRVKQIPRQDFVKPENWNASSDMPHPYSTPVVQTRHFTKDPKRKALTKARQQWVKRACLHTYEGYKKHAFGHDEIRPISRNTRDSYNAWGATLVDTLDLLLIMDLSHEYNVARTHVRSLDFALLTEKQACDGSLGASVHLFETVIRYLGGLLSAYDLSGDELMLARAKELGNWLLPAFNTDSGWPLPFYRLGSYVRPLAQGWQSADFQLRRNPDGIKSPRILAAELGTLSMEFTRLSQVTGDPTFYNTVLRIQERLSQIRSEYGTLVPHVLESDGRRDGQYTIGGMIDSYYEYMIKMVQLLGDEGSVWGHMYRRTVQDITLHLAVNVTITPDRSGVVVIGSRGPGSRVRPMLEHLATFAGGMFALGSKLLSREEDLLLASELTESAVWAYRSTATGLMPEHMYFFAPDDPHRVDYLDVENESRARVKGSPLGASDQVDLRYLGRPESIESVFYMYRVTGDPKWQDYGWRMFTSWIKHSLTSVGLANIVDVNELPPDLEDIQESFVLTETLKYYYLLFSPPDLLSLDDYVFNTEAHPFKLPLRQHRSFWSGPDHKVDALYADPRDRRFFESSNATADEAPIGRGTARQQQWVFDNCLS